MIKKVLFLIWGFLPLVLSAQVKFMLTGKVEAAPIKNQIAYLSYTHENEPMLDSTKVLNGKFEFKGVVEQPVVAKVYYKDNTGKISDSKQLYLENEVTKLIGQGSLSSSEILNSPTTLAYDAYKKELASMPMEAQFEFNRKYVKQHPNSMVSLSVLETFIFPIPRDHAELMEMYNSLSDQLRNWPKGVRLKALIEPLKDIAIGNQAPDFRQLDSLGTVRRLNDFKGKYILLDFWASWCKPCRAENPMLVAIYEKFKSKYFEIVGVSIDVSWSAWMKAVAEDRLTWVQLCEEKGKKNTAADLYHIQAIPQNFLIDRQGKIIAKNLKGEELEAFLNKIL